MSEQKETLRIGGMSCAACSGRIEKAIGANVAGFLKVADAMLAQGIV